jgi:hypothetical protein
MNKDYSALYDAIKSFGECIHPLESVWIIYVSNVDLNASQITDVLHAHMTQEDTLFVCKIDGKDRNGWMAKSAWQWLHTREQQANI